jgi:phage gp16-like protein
MSPLRRQTSVFFKMLKDESKLCLADTQQMEYVLHVGMKDGTYNHKEAHRRLIDELLEWSR